MRHLMTTLPLALLAASVFSGPVAAAVPVTVVNEAEVGSGQPDDPHVAVDEAGTAHVAVHYRRSDGATVVGYCRLPRGAGACDAQQVFAVDTAGNAPAVIRYEAPGTVAILIQECCETSYGTGNAQTVAFVSTDGGSTFGPRDKLAPGPTGSGSESAVNPSDAILVGGRFGWVNSTATAGHMFQSDALGGGVTTTRADIFPGGRFDAAVGLVDAATFSPLVVSEDDDGPLGFRRYGGGDPNDEAAWSPEQRIDDEGAEPELAEGPGGLYLAYGIGDPGRQGTVVRRFDGTGFGGAVATGLAYGDGNDIAQDGSGRLYAVADDNLDIKVAISSDAGATWSAPAGVVTGESGLGNIHVGVAPGGSGWVVYRTGGGAVRAVELPGATSGATEVPCAAGTAPTVTCLAAAPGSEAEFAAAARRLCRAPGLPRRSTTYRRVIVGTAADERIVATNANDVVLSLGGEDDVNARGGKDCVITGAGDDDADGGGGADLIATGNADDEVDAAGGADRVVGGRGRDRLSGGGGNDRITGGGGNDRLRGGSGRDRLAGNAGLDRLIGGAGNDIVGGGRGRDVFIGGGGRDRINARGQRRERVDCGAGRDTVRTRRPERDRIRANCERVLG